MGEVPSAEGECTRKEPGPPRRNEEIRALTLHLDDGDHDREYTDTHSRVHITGESQLSKTNYFLILKEE